MYVISTSCLARCMLIDACHFAELMMTTAQCYLQKGEEFPKVSIQRTELGIPTSEDDGDTVDMSLFLKIVFQDTMENLKYFFRRNEEELAHLDQL